MPESSSFEALREAKKPFTALIPPTCETEQEGFGVRKCANVMGLATGIAKLALEKGCEVERQVLDNFSDFVSGCPSSLEIDSGCGTGHQLCRYTEMPKYGTPEMDVLVQKLFES